MRILMITVRADFGGGPEHVYQLVKNAPADMDFYVACPPDRPYDSRFAALTGRERMMDIPHRRFGIKAFWRVYRFAKSHGIQVIHSHGKGAGLYSRPLSALLRIPCLHTFHGLHIASYGIIGRMAYILLERCLSFFTDIIVAVSAGESRRLVEQRAVPKNRIRVIPNGVFVPAENTYLSHEDIPKKVVSVSRFDYSKNTEMLLAVAQYLKEMDATAGIVFEILGEGENAGKIQRLAEEKHLSDAIRLTGPVDDPRRYYRQALCYLSTSRWEGMPLAVLEAMSEGVPVIATDVTGHNDIIIHDQSGLLYGLHEPRRAAEFILHLTASRPDRDRLSRNGYERVKQYFEVKIMTARTTELYRHMVRS